MIRTQKEKYIKLISFENDYKLEIELKKLIDDFAEAIIAPIISNIVELLNQRGVLPMSVYSFQINFPGQNNGVVPRIGHLYAPTNTLSEITAAGFLDNYIKSQNFSLLPTDIVAVAASNGNQFYKPVFTNGSCQLTVLP